MKPLMSHKRNPGLGIGLHINLIEEKPVTPTIDSQSIVTKRKPF